MTSTEIHPPTVETEEERVNRTRMSLTTAGLSGYQNVGNTCYMNSVLQTLAATPFFSTLIRTNYYFPFLQDNIVLELSKKGQTDENGNITIKKDDVQKKIDDSMTNALTRTLQAAWAKNCTVKPETFKRVIALNNEQFIGFMQNDADELLRVILTKLHEETRVISKAIVKFLTPNQLYLVNLTAQMSAMLSDENNETTTAQKAQEIDAYYKILNANADDWAMVRYYLQMQNYYEKEGRSVVTDLFTGMFLSEVVCSVCNNISMTFESFNIFTVEIPTEGDATLAECMTQFCKEEHLTGDNKFNCSRCKMKVDAVKKLSVWTSPKILIIQLKRFKMLPTGQPVKNNSVIKFPIDNLTLDGVYSPRNKTDTPKYNLVGISDHSGGCEGGHYTAHCKSLINGRWYTFDDSRVHHIDSEKKDEKLQTKNAYILFYESV